MADFNQAVQLVLKLEGGYSNDPLDPGGATNFGIIQTLANKYGYIGDMKNLTEQQAINIYKEAIWDKLKLDNVNNQDIANQLFNIAVNLTIPQDLLQGVRIAGTFLQRSLNALNQNKNWSNITVDGSVGNITIQTLNQACQNQLYTTNILKCIIALQRYYYLSITEENQTFKIYINGWFLRT